MSKFDVNSFLNSTRLHATDAKVSLEDFLDLADDPVSTPYSDINREEVVSNEGIFDSIGDFFRNIFRGTKPEAIDEKKDELKLTLKQLKDTYLDDNWLKKRRIVTGTVKPGKHSKFFEGDYVKTMLDLTALLTKTRKANLAISDKAYEKVKDGFRFIHKRRYTNADAVMEMNDKLNPKYTPVKFAVTGKESDFITGEVELPALTHDEIKKLAQLVYDLLTVMYTQHAINDEWFDLYFSTVSDGRQKYYLYSRNGAKILSEGIFRYDEEAAEALESIILKLYDYTEEYFKAYYDRPCNLLSNIQEIVKGAVRYIDACVK